MRRASIQVLIVDDFEPWRRFLRLALFAYADLEVIAEASDGFEAADKARQPQPDLILLDTGLPGQNGIDAARKIRELSPASKIHFVSEDRSGELAEEPCASGMRLHSRVTCGREMHDRGEVLETLDDWEPYISVRVG